MTSLIKIVHMKSREIRYGLLEVSIGKGETCSALTFIESDLELEVLPKDSDLLSEFNFSLQHYSVDVLYGDVQHGEYIDLLNRLAFLTVAQMDKRQVDDQTEIVKRILGKLKSEALLRKLLARCSYEHILDAIRERLNRFPAKKRRRAKLVLASSQAS